MGATELAEDAGLPIDPIYGGFEVNEELKAFRDVYVAGDAASFLHSQHGRIRHEHHDNALVTGKIAGLNMTGEHKTVNVNSLFWSGLVCSGLVWCGLVWSGLVWSGLVWFGCLVCLSVWSVWS